MKPFIFKKKYITHSIVLVMAIIGYFYGDTIGTSIQSSKNTTTTVQPTTPTVFSVATSSASYPVIRVVDGDTFVVEVDGKKETIRLIGIDTPEVVDPRKPVQCYGKEASAKAKELLEGTFIVLTHDPTQGERDTYKRLLRYAFLEDGTNVNEYMIAEGYAHEYTYQSTPYQYQKKFKAAETYAREQKKGLWADGVCD